MNMCIKEAIAEKKTLRFLQFTRIFCVCFVFFFAVICGPGLGAAETT